MKKTYRYAVVVTAGCALMLGLGGCAGDSGKAVSSAASAVESEEDQPETIMIPTDSAAAVAEEVTDDTIDEFISLGEYKGLKIEAPEGAAIEDGMTAIISYVGRIDGSEFPGGTLDRYELLIGSDSLAAGFDAQLKGHKQGETVSATVTYDADYGDPDLAGKEVVYDVDILKVYAVSPDVACAQFLDSCKLAKYPESLFEEWEKVYLDSYRDFMPDETKEYSKEEILAGINMDEKVFHDMVEANVKDVLVVRSVFGKEKVSRDSEEYKAVMEAYMDRYGYDSMKDALSTGVSEAEVMYGVDMDMLKEILVKYEEK